MGVPVSKTGKNKTTAVNVMTGENISIKTSFTVKGKTAAVYEIK